MKSVKLTISILLSGFVISTSAFAQVGMMPPVNYALSSGASGLGLTAGTNQLTGAVLSGTEGSLWGKTCGTKYGAWACPLMAMALMAALSMKKASGQSNVAGGEFQGYDPNDFKYDQNGNPVISGDGSGGGGGRGPAGDNSNSNIGANSFGEGPGGLDASLNQLKSDLAKSGTVISPDGTTVTTADGRKFDISKGAGSGSKADFMSMGMTAAEADLAMSEAGKNAKKLAEQMKALSKLTADGGGGGGGGGAGTAGANGSDADAAALARMMRERQRAKPKLSGLTRKLGDDLIGVAGDNIFEMVTRRYQARDKDNAFIKEP